MLSPHSANARARPEKVEQILCLPESACLTFLRTIGD